MLLAREDVSVHYVKMLMSMLGLLFIWLHGTQNSQVPTTITKIAGACILEHVRSKKFDIYCSDTSCLYTISVKVFCFPSRRFSCIPAAAQMVAERTILGNSS